MAPLRLISIITYSGSGIQRRRYPEVAIKGVNKKARGTRRGKNAQESERTRGSRDAPPRSRLLPRNLGPVRRGFKADDLYRVVFLRFCGGTLKSKREKPQEKKEQQQKKSCSQSLFSVAAFFAQRIAFLFPRYTFHRQTGSFGRQHVTREGEGGVGGEEGGLGGYAAKCEPQM